MTTTTETRRPKPPARATSGPRCAICHRDAHRPGSGPGNHGHVYRAPEATPEQAAQWSEHYAEGYRTGRGDARWGASPRVPLVAIPPEMPGETGAAYVARHLARAWDIGYTRAYRYETR